jgi:predicted nucleic acid-binding protein
MTVETTFVDSNVLVYAYDTDAGTKHDVAADLLVRLWNDESGRLSTQVLQEFYVTVTRKLPKQLPRRTARDTVDSYATWHPHRPDVGDLVTASELEERHHLSFWDALIVVAAQRSRAVSLLTEDLNDGQRFNDLQVSNPFA